MKKVLVTGATGFLGTHLVEKLKAKPAPDAQNPFIRILCRGGSRWVGDPRIEILHGDICDPKAVAAAVTGVTHVFHLAGFVSRNPADAARLYETHVGGTRLLCESALAQGSPKIVLCSSSGTTAASRQPVMFTEDAVYAYDIVGHWPYYLSKIYQEKLALSYFTRNQLPVVVVNPSLLLGPGDDRHSSTGDIRIFLRGYFKNITSGGLNLVDVRDAADALIAAMKVGVPGRRYLIGGHNMTVKVFFRFLEQITGVRAPRWGLSERWARRGAALLRRLYRGLGFTYPVEDTTVEMAYRFWYVDNSRARKEFGFTPRPAEETLRDTVNCLQQRTPRRRR